MSVYRVREFSLSITVADEMTGSDVHGFGIHEDWGAELGSEFHCNSSAPQSSWMWPKQWILGLAR